MSYEIDSEGFSKICKLSELQNNSGRMFFIDGTDFAVFKIGDKVFALSNICPHQHAALIYSGFLENNFVICPAHGWKFSLETGKQPDGRNGLTVYQTKVIDNFVYVKVQKKIFDW